MRAYVNRLPELPFAASLLLLLVVPGTMLALLLLVLPAVLLARLLVPADALLLLLVDAESAAVLLLLAAPGDGLAAVLADVLLGAVVEGAAAAAC